MVTMPPRVRRPLMGDELLRSLGDIPAHRVCFDPPPGQATEADLLAYLEGPEKRLFELVDGTLVEKPMGAKESFVATKLSARLTNWSEAGGDRGMILGEAGTLRFLGRQVRMPDVSFTYWERLPGRHLPAEAIPDLAPDLAVEVLSDSNTPAEIARKLGEYFADGTRLAWVIDPDARTARAHTAPDVWADLTAADALDGADVLPGFRLPLADLFAKLPPVPPKPKRKKKAG